MNEMREILDEVEKLPHDTIVALAKCGVLLVDRLLDHVDAVSDDVRAELNAYLTIAASIT